jgi:hypothetical protein
MDFNIGCPGDKIWNLHELVEYLSANQNKSINIRISPEAVCLKTIGLYNLLDNFNFEQVNIITQNPFEHSEKYNILFRENHWLNKQEFIDPDLYLHTWNQQKKFFCFYHRPTAGRLGIASHLLKNHKEDTHIHFSATTEVDNLAQFELDKLLTYNISSITETGELLKTLPLLLAPSNRYTSTEGYYYDDPLTNLYKDILIDVVVESHVKGDTFFPTEKTTRPMWLKKPFIIFASKNYLDYLHQMGFMTFNNFWSEDYDGYEGRDRFVKILQLIDDISKKSRSELNDMYWGMEYTLNHNYNLLQNQSYTTQLKFMD